MSIIAKGQGWRVTDSFNGYAFETWNNKWTREVTFRSARALVAYVQRRTNKVPQALYELPDKGTRVPLNGASVAGEASPQIA